MKIKFNYKELEFNPKDYENIEKICSTIEELKGLLNKHIDDFIYVEKNDPEDFKDITLSAVFNKVLPSLKWKELKLSEEFESFINKLDYIISKDEIEELLKIYKNDYLKFMSWFYQILKKVMNEEYSIYNKITYSNLTNHNIILIILLGDLYKTFSPKSNYKLRMILDEGFVIEHNRHDKKGEKIYIYNSNGDIIYILPTESIFYKNNNPIIRNMDIKEMELVE